MALELVLELVGLLRGPSPRVPTAGVGFAAVFRRRWCREAQTELLRLQAEGSLCTRKGRYKGVPNKKLQNDRRCLLPDCISKTPVAALAHPAMVDVQPDNGLRGATHTPHATQMPAKHGKPNAQNGRIICIHPYESRWHVQGVNGKQ
jgi:hypothetical protein